MTLLDRACACSYKNLPKYRSYHVSKTAPRVLGQRGTSATESRRLPTVGPLTVEREIQRIKRVTRDRVGLCDCVVSSPSGLCVQARPDPPPFHIRNT